MENNLFEFILTLFPNLKQESINDYILEMQKKFPKVDSESLADRIIEKIFQDAQDTAIEHELKEIEEPEDISAFYYIIKRTWCSEPIYILKNRVSKASTSSSCSTACAISGVPNAGGPLITQSQVRANPQLEDLLPFILSNFEEPSLDSNALPIDYRQEAAKLWHERQALYLKASEAHQKYKNNVARPIASHYVDEGKEISRKIESFQSMAAYLLLLQYNKEVINKVDFHGLYVHEVLKILFPLLFKYFFMCNFWSYYARYFGVKSCSNLEKKRSEPYLLSNFLPTESSMVSGNSCVESGSTFELSPINHHPFTLITGIGKHSFGKHQLKPAVLNALEHHRLHWTFKEGQGSVIVFGCQLKEGTS